MSSHSISSHLISTNPIHLISSHFVSYHVIPSHLISLDFISSHFFLCLCADLVFFFFLDAPCQRAPPVSNPRPARGLKQRRGQAQGSREAEGRGPRGVHGRATAHRTPLQSADPNGSEARERPVGTATRDHRSPARKRPAMVSEPGAGPRVAQGTPRSRRRLW